MISNRLLTVATTGMGKQVQVLLLARQALYWLSYWPSLVFHLFVTLL